MSLRANKRNVAAFDASRAILVDLLVYDAIGVIITVVAILSQVLNVLGWGIEVVYCSRCGRESYSLGKDPRDFANGNKRPNIAFS